MVSTATDGRDHINWTVWLPILALDKAQLKGSELARLMGISPNSIGVLVKSGHLPKPYAARNSTVRSVRGPHTSWYARETRWLVRDIVDRFYW